MNKTIDLLESSWIKFRKIELWKSPESALDIVKWSWCNLEQVLKTLFFIWETKNILVVLPWNKKVDIKKLKALTHQKNIRISKEDELEKFTWNIANWIWPFSSTKEDFTKIIEKSSFDEKIISIWSWEPKLWLKISSFDLRKVWDWEIENICKN